MRRIYKKYESLILASAVLFLLMTLIGLRYDYYYDLNDDVLIKDIMAGVYTGTPEAHNIQILYPLSFLISLLYRIFPEAPVYGLFLCLCQYGCLWLILERSLHFFKRTVAKLAAATVEGVAFYVLFLEHLLFVQYTITSAILAAAAAFLFITGLKNRFGRNEILCVVLAVLAYNLRTEMLLLMLPFICVAGIYRWSMEEKILAKENIQKYFAVFGCILAGLFAGTVINVIAFQKEEWKPYTEFFNSRTQLYDFQGIPSYEGNETLYAELGLTESEQYMLLEQYNFGLDDTVDADLLDAVSEYQESRRKEENRFARLRDSLKLCVYRMHHKEPTGSLTEDDYPWNILAMLGYVSVFLLMFWRNGKKAAKGIGVLCLLGLVRMTLWMYILMNGRYPVRITHPLYFMELIILTAMLFTECRQRPLRDFVQEEGRAAAARKLSVTAAAIAMLGGAAILIGLAPEVTKETDRSYASREAANTVDRTMKEYCREHKENFYFIDVYSAVSYPTEPYLGVPYSEKMFVNADNRLGNYDSMGGWLVKSPLSAKKLQAFGMDSMREGILTHENSYLMAETAKGTEYISDYFKDQEIEVTIEQTDTLCDIISVYRVSPVAAAKE